MYIAAIWSEMIFVYLASILINLILLFPSIRCEQQALDAPQSGAHRARLADFVADGPYLLLVEDESVEIVPKFQNIVKNIKSIFTLTESELYYIPIRRTHIYIYICIYLSSNDKNKNTAYKFSLVRQWRWRRPSQAALIL